MGPPPLWSRGRGTPRSKQWSSLGDHNAPGRKILHPKIGRECHFGHFLSKICQKNILLQRARRIYIRGPAYPSPGSVGTPWGCFLCQCVGAVCAGELKSPKNVPLAVLDTKVWILKSFRCVRWTTRGCHMPPRGGDQADTWPGGRGGEFWQEGMPGGGPLSNGRIVVYGRCPSSPLNVPPLGGGGGIAASWYFETW